MAERAARDRQSPQLPLPLRQPGTEGLERFIAYGNEPLVAALRLWTRGGGEPYLYIHGAPSGGKTQLLLCAAEEARKQGLDVVYVALDTHGLTPEVLDQLEHCDGVLLDALQACAGDSDWERSLFNLYNCLRDRQGQLLVAARVPASQLRIKLADLASRLSAGASFNLKPLDDDGLFRFLQVGGKQRGLDLSDAVIRYVLTHCPRDPQILAQLLDRVDHVALAEQRQPTIHLVSKLVQRDEISAPSASNATSSRRI
jgi:DnaA family protein